MVAGSLKLKRELARPFKLFAAKLWLPFRSPAGALRRRRYDATRERLVRVTVGAGSCRSEVAILLTYQPKGISDSTFFTLSYLEKQGISPVVVSNILLTDADRERLASNSWLVMERPNVGYDFGGYREGILTVLERKGGLDAIYVLNDSIWFPLKAESGIITKCRAAPEDIFGIQIDTLNDKGGDEFIHSFFYRFSRGLISSRAFKDYWRSANLMGSKQEVIEEYEFKLARDFIRKGFTVGGIYGVRELRAIIRGMDDEIIKGILADQYKVSKGRATYLRPILEGNMSPREMRERLAQLVEQKSDFRKLFMFHPWVYQRLDLGFLKKSRYRIFNALRAEIRRLKLHADYHPAVRDEIERWDEA